MANQNNNIFLTTENLAFALPLLFVCACYAYFKYLPTVWALSILAVVFVLFQIKSHFQAHKDKKLTELDDSMVRELVGDDESKALQAKQQEDARKQRKAKAALEMRLAQERKAQNKKSSQKKKKQAEDDEDDDDDALLMFAKGSRDVKKKK